MCNAVLSLLLIILYSQNRTLGSILLYSASTIPFIFQSPSYPLHTHTHTRTLFQSLFGFLSVPHVLFYSCLLSYHLPATTTFFRTFTLYLLPVCFIFVPSPFLFFSFSFFLFELFDHRYIALAPLLIIFYVLF